MGPEAQKISIIEQLNIIMPSLRINYTSVIVHIMTSIQEIHTENYNT